MEKIWLPHYPAGVPAEIDLSGLRSIGEFFEDAVARFGDRPAFISGATGVALSYRKLDLYAGRFAAKLQALGLAPGARVALMMPNLLQYPVCLFGALRCGFVVVNVNPMYTPRELTHQLQDSGAEAIVVLDLFAHTLEQALPETQVRHILVTGVADLLPLPLRWLAAVGLRVRKAIKPYALPGHLSLKKVLFDRHMPAPRPVKLQPGDLALLQYTGGTTGAAKGAMLTHLNVLANVSQGYVWLEPFLNPEADKIAVVAIPMFHIFALRLAINCMGQGGTSVLVADPRNTRAFVKVLSRHRFVLLPAVNTLFAKLLDEPSFARLDFSALRVSAGGGSPIQRSVAERWKAVTGCTLVEGYGLTECSPGVSMAPLNQATHDGTVGLPLPSTEISLRDPAGREVGLGEPGEVCVRGPQVMRGYWQRPDETAAVMTPDGFLRTGDIATMDARGALRIVDRLKELILVSGFNVYPSEVEAVALAHPGVAEAAAVSRPNAQTGEAVHLFVVRGEPGLSAEALKDHCRGQLAAYKVPRHVHFVAELPKNPIGKVLRRLLAESLKET